MTNPDTLDLEARAHSEHAQELRLWLRLLACSQLIEKRVRTQLRERFDTTLPRFDLMAQLERHPEGLKMKELSQRLMVTGGNVTGITDQLEQEKLVVRVPDSKDGRAFSVKLTPAGRKAFAQMAEVHESWVAELLQDISQEDKGRLIDPLSQMKGHLYAREEKEKP